MKIPTKSIEETTQFLEYVIAQKSRTIDQKLLEFYTQVELDAINTIIDTRQNELE